MLESFFIQSNKELVEKHQRQKSLLTYEIMGTPAFRELQPEAVGDRTRIDLMWFQGELGIRGATKPDFSFDFLKVENPDTPSTIILQMLEVFPSLSFPIPLAQLRFREGWGGERGLWIDASNEAIHDLLKSQSGFLEKAFEQGWIVEIGQKHKEVAFSEERGWFLEAARPKVWLPTFDKDNQELLPLSLISLFSQPGPEVNRALIATAFDLMDEAQIPTQLSWCEWGAGYGNLSLAMVSRLGSTDAWVSEFDPAAGALLEKNFQINFPDVKVSCQPAENITFPKHSFWLIDPPRSGFSKLLEGIDQQYPGPEWVLAFHCHKKGLLSDTLLLRDKNYDLFKYSTVDAFPATPHHEVISLWKRK